jgi:uncharacterized oxidoreductase
MSRLYQAESVERAGIALFREAGAARNQLKVIVGSLVKSSLMGHDSHGVIRIPEYLGFIADGSIVAAAPIKVERTSPTTAVVDCHRGFGAVGAERAIRESIEIARGHGTACVITRRCNHVGRLGAWVELAAEEGMIALATCNSPVHGHSVLPWGGRDGRLGTNPIAYAVPTGGMPIVADFSTSIAPEGKIRFHRNEGKPVPDGWIVDAEGKPTNDPDAFYGPPRGGILPLGGSAGHKGFALALLVEILGNVLAGFTTQDPRVFGNGVCFIVVNPSAFCPVDQFRQLMDETIAYIKSSRPAPGFEEVLLPGELEFRTQRHREEAGIPVDNATLEAVRGHGARLGVDVDAILNPKGDE